MENAVLEENGAKDMHNATGKINGADGPSGKEADLWHRFLCSRQLKKKPGNLCNALAKLARK